MRTGRPTKLTPAVQAKIVAGVERGNYGEVAAALAGVSRASFFRWLARGEAEEQGPFRDFRDAIKEAESAGEDYAVEMVRKAMPGNWQAAMTYLERRHPDRWARKQHVEHTGPGGKDLFDAERLLSHPTLAPLSPVDRRRVAAGLRKVLPMLAAAAGEADEAEAVEVTDAESAGGQSSEEIPA